MMPDGCVNRAGRANERLDFLDALGQLGVFRRHSSITDMAGVFLGGRRLLTGEDPAVGKFPHAVGRFAGLCVGGSHIRQTRGHALS
jgi:hypothetical protein